MRHAALGKFCHLQRGQRKGRLPHQRSSDVLTPSAILLLGSARDVFHDRVKAIYRVWIDAIATVLIECGMNEELAQQRAQDAVIAIQGSLIVSQGLDDPSGFVRLMQHLPEELCKGTLPNSRLH